jgi:hypothetical protein
MEDDLTFGASVWAAPSDTLSPPSNKGIGSANALSAFDFIGDAFDDSDEFGPSMQTTSTQDENDDFGDFGDFGEVQGDVIRDFEGDAFEEEIRTPEPSEADWEPLRLDPMPSRAELQKQVNDIFGRIWPNDDISQVTTQEGIREVGGIAQILVTPER